MRVGYTCQIMELEDKLRQVQDKGAAPACILVDDDAVAEQRRAAEQAPTDQLAQRGASLSSSSSTKDLMKPKDASKAIPLETSESVKQSLKSLIV
jgi:hypothetical protein